MVMSSARQQSQHSRVSVAILDATEVSLNSQEDAGVPGAAVLQQGGGGLPGALRRSAVERRSWKHDAQRRSRVNEDTQRVT